jgi:predicted CXXCH cytochrome family protein
MRRGLIRSAGSLAVLVLGVAALAALAVSCAPATSERSADVRRTCAQCHPDKVASYQTGFVHQPVKETKCETCHLPHGLVGTLLMRQQPPALCLPCHPAFR